MELDQLLPGFYGPIAVFQVIELDDAPIEPGGGVIRVDCQGSVKSGDRLIGIAAAAIHDAQVGQHIRIVRIDGKRLVVGLNGLGEVITVKIIIAQLGPGLIVAGELLF